MLQNIWQPLGMEDTTFRPERRTNFKSRMADMCLRRNGRPVAHKQRFAIPAQDDLGGLGYYSVCPSISWRG